MININSSTKRCSRCKLEKAADTLNFKPNIKLKSGLNSWCRPCVKTYSATRHTRIMIRLPESPINKTCRKCLIGQSKNNFYKNKNSKLSSWCKLCTCVYQKLRHSKKPIKTNTFDIVDSKKWCNGCNVFLDIVSFDKNLKLRSRLASRCKNCVKENCQKRWRLKNPKPILPKVEGHKYCSVCLTSKPTTIVFFPKQSSSPPVLAADCKECRSKYSNKYRKLNPEKVRKSSKLSRLKHIKKRNKRAKEYARKNRSQINKNLARKRKEDPFFKIKSNLRKSVGDSIKTKNFRKKSNLSEYLGLNPQEFKKYLESLFKSEMSWDNYGSGKERWCIDHIIPIKTAVTVKDLYKLNHYTNLQPMWTVYNFAKSDMSQEEWGQHKLDHIIDESVRPPSPRVGSAS